MRLRLKILFGAILLFVAAEAFAQGGFKVSGTVKDEYGEPVTGVSVICEANKKGAITDAKGYYEVLAASESAKLVYSFMGYKTQEVQVRKRAVINVVLEEDAAPGGADVPIRTAYRRQRRTAAPHGHIILPISAPAATGCRQKWWGRARRCRHRPGLPIPPAL